ncbi:MAG: polar amino acid transport system permease protein [Ilumatobacteraceae bacterium]
MLTYRKMATVALLVPPTGVPAMVYSMRAARLAKEGEIESARHQGERARDWAWYSIGVGLSVYIVAFVVWLLLTNNHAVSQVFFGWATVTDGRAWHSLVKGFWINVQVFLIAEVIVLVWALVVAILRLLPGPACKPVRWLVTVYVDVFRGIPALLVILIIGLGLPQAHVPILGSFSDMDYAILALSLTYGAYVSEVYRAGIESVHWSQTAAARSLGLSHGQTMRHVVVPQAVRRVIPPLLNDFIGLQKDTSLINALGVLDVVSRARFVNNSRGTLAAYSMAALLFLLVTIPFTRWLDGLIRRQQAKTLAGR